MNTCFRSPYVTSSLTRECVCSLQLLLVLASTAILRSDSHGTHDHILLSQIRDLSPSWRVRSPMNRVAQLCPQELGSLFVASYDSQGYGGGIRLRLHTGTAMSVVTFVHLYMPGYGRSSNRLVYRYACPNRLFNLLWWLSWHAPSQEGLCSMELVSLVFL
jgi:hypothetical protein